MDHGSTPWRVLEDPPDRTPAGAGPVTGSVSAAFPRSALLAAGGAVLLGIAAFFLAFSSGPGGGIPVDPTTSGVIAGAGDASAGALAGAQVDLAGTGTQLVVEAVGAVVKPGVYRLPAGARVGDLVDAAGGYGPRVDTARAERELNLAAPLHDGDQIRVPSRDDPAAAVPPPAASGGSAGGSALVDLNHATAEELDALPGIGPVTAAKILAARDEQPFSRVDDLRTRKLVGEKTFANLKDLVTVR